LPAAPVKKAKKGAPPVEVAAPLEMSIPWGKWAKYSLNGVFSSEPDFFVGEQDKKQKSQIQVV